MNRVTPLAILFLMLLIVAQGNALSAEPATQPATTAADVDRMLDEIRVPAMEITAVPFRQAVGRLHEAAKREVNMVIKTEGDQLESPVTVSVREGSLRDALKALSTAAGMKMQVNAYSVFFSPLVD